MSSAIARFGADLRVMALMERAVALSERDAGRAALERACSLLERAIGRDPDCVRAYFYLAPLLLTLGREREALSALRRISALDHSRMPGYRDLRVPSPRRFPGLLARLDSALARDSGCAWGHVLRAFLLKSLLLHEQAKDPMTAAVELEPRSAALWALRSRVRLTNRPERFDGLGDIDRAVALAPSWGWLHCWRGEALRRSGRPQEAAAALRRGLRLDPTYKLGYAWRGGIAAARGRFAEAARDLTRALERDPIYDFDVDYAARAEQRSWALNQRMLAHRGLGRVGAALDDLNAAHALSPRYGWAYNPSGHARVYARAVEELEPALRGRRRAWARAWRGWTFERWGRGDDALREWELALKEDPSLGWVWTWLGQLLLVNGEHRAAQGALERALAATPAYSPAWGLKGRLERARGRPRAAAAAYARATALDPRCAWALAERAECLARLGRRAAAAADRERALGLYPSYPVGAAR